MNITLLLVRGLIVQGTIITQKRYFETFSGDVNLFYDAASEQIQKAAAKHGSTLAEIESQFGDFIHLENAMVILSAESSLEFPAWRGRIDSSDGYVMLWGRSLSREFTLTTDARCGPKIPPPSKSVTDKVKVWK